MDTPSATSRACPYTTRPILVTAALESTQRDVFMLQELLWGYEDPLLAKLSWLKPNLPTSFRLIQNATSAAEALEGHQHSCEHR